MLTEQQENSLKLENQLCFPLYAAARRVVALYTPYLKPLGLTYTQYIVFLALWEKDNITVGELGEKLYLDSGTLTPLLKKMEKEGWLLRTRSKKDERIVRISLTKKGREMKEAVKNVPSEIGACIRISPNDAKTLYSILYKTIESTGSKSKN